MANEIRSLFITYSPSPFSKCMESFLHLCSYMLPLLYNMENIEIMKIRNDKDCLVTEGFRHHLFRKSDSKIAWRCWKAKSQKCKGTIPKNLKYAIIEKTEHSWLPDSALIGINRKMETCRKRFREEISVPENKILQKDILELYEKSYDLVANILKYENVKSSLCKERRRILGTLQNPPDSVDIGFPENFNNSSKPRKFSLAWHFKWYWKKTSSSCWERSTKPFTRRKFVFLRRDLKSLKVVETVCSTAYHACRLWEHINPN